ncbi:MAG: helix-turn-helix domain-containing protein [Hamadaea sp.]|nr:helix-turn-helix domain-containing protein [Hamadaea sp.]NUR50131.1 helix-turn-helix domain-containing protein [Hamadaea sp.]NUT02130.1 helix-turn-helix domain-containing protein [Hamadaea sp.]
MGKPHVVAVAVTDHAPIFELAILCEIFGISRPDLADPWYELRLCAAHPGPIRTAQGLLMQTPYGLEDLVAADTVIAAAMYRPFQVTPPPTLVAAMKEAYARGARLAAICSGAYALAEAGLLDDRPATTHWMYAEEFGVRYPAVKLDPDVLYVDDGQILTSAGTGAGIDLCLHMVANDFGATVANTVARRMVVPPHRDGGQAQYVETARSVPPGSASLGPVLDWAREHLAEPLTVADLAERARLGQRTFVRRFAETTGTSPLRWLTIERVRLAQQLLETTDQPVERIAGAVGFGTAANLRQHFSRATSVSPQTYRKVFRSRV